MILKLKPNSSTFIIWNSKPQISNQLSGINAINHTLWNTICSFPTLFLSDFSYLKLNLSYFSWFSPRNIQKQHCDKKKNCKKHHYSYVYADGTIFRTCLQSGASSQLIPQQILNISKFSFPPFKLRNNPWNNVGTHRTKKKSLDCCSYAATQPWPVLRHYRVTSRLAANWPQICKLSGH